MARNRIRRRLREAVTCSGDIRLPGWDLVLIARPTALTGAFADIIAELVSHCRKLGFGSHEVQQAEATKRPRDSEERRIYKPTKK